LLGFSLFCGCSKCSIGIDRFFCEKNTGYKLLEQGINTGFLEKLETNASDIYNILQLSLQRGNNK